MSRLQYSQIVLLEVIHPFNKQIFLGPEFASEIARAPTALGGLSSHVDSAEMFGVLATAEAVIITVK